MLDDCPRVVTGRSCKVDGYVNKLMCRIYVCDKVDNFSKLQKEFASKPVA